jgi:hypothetical protein
MKHLLILLAFISCKDFSRENEVTAQRLRTEKLDTLKLETKPITSKPEIFETAFYYGTRAKMDTIPVSFYAVNIGKIKISSGKIIACDPIVMHDATPFTQTFPTGQFPVQLAIAKIDGDERVAFSRIYFSEKPVVKWEFALQPKQKPIPVGDSTFYGYGVDGGIGLFIDEEANKAFDKLRDKDESIWEKAFNKEMTKTRRTTWEYVIYNFEKYNLASFTTGYGDGSYGTYIGFDDNGNPCRLLTDFSLVDWWKK